MCVYSLVQADWYDKYKGIQPWPNIFPYPPIPPVSPGLPPPASPYVSRDEFEKLTKELIELLKKAKIYDEQNNQKDCETEDKKRKIQELADKFGIQVNFP